MFLSKSKLTTVLPKHIVSSSTCLIETSKEEVVLSHDNKELFVQRFVSVLDQSRKHVEVQNQRKDTLADFTIQW